MSGPIEIVTETWFSPDLHTMVLRKHSDPRLGDSTYKLTDIKRNEPDAALFQPPPGTKVSVEPMLELHKEMLHPKSSLFSPLLVGEAGRKRPAFLLMAV